MSDSKVVVVDVSSWIVEAFFFFNILACLALFLLGYFWHVWRCYYKAIFGVFGVVFIGRISCWIEWLSSRRFPILA